MNEGSSKDDSRLYYGIALGGGAILWLGTSALSGRTEAWDSSLYWSISYPLCIALAGVLGYLAPQKPWRWGLAIMLVQPVILAFSASGFGLLPLGLLMFALLALPPMGMARLAARLRKGRAA